MWLPNRIRLWKRLASSATRSARRGKVPTTRLCLEALEVRIVPTTSVSYNDFVWSVALDPANNVYVSGSITGTADLRGTATTSPQWLQGPAQFLAEYNSNGGLVWEKSLTQLFGANEGLGKLQTTFTDSNGNTSLYVTHIASANSTPTFWISNVAADGSTVNWSTSTGGIPGKVAVDTNGNAYILGTFNGTVDFDPQSPGTHVLTSTANSTDAFLLKVNANGSFGWVEQLGGAGNQAGSSITVQGNTVYVTGSFNQAFDPAGFTDKSAGGIAQPDSFLAEYDTSGNYKTAYQFVDASVGRVAVDSNGIYLAGTFSTTADLNPSPNTQYLVNPTGGSGDSDNFLEKLNSDGSFAWADQIGGTSSDTVGDLVVHNGLLYLSGDFSNTVNFNPSGSAYNLTAAGGQDAFVAQYDEAGALGWVQQMGSATRYAVAPASEMAGPLAVSDSGVYTGGYFAPGQASFGSKTLTDYAGWDGFLSNQDLSGAVQWVFKVESVVRTVDNSSSGYSEVGKGWRNLSSGFDGGSRYHNKGSGGEQAVWNFSNLPPGTYQVLTTWVANSRQNATNAPYSINGGQPILVNQQVAPSDVLSDLYSTLWQNLGTATVGSNGTLTVQLSDAANGRVVADAVRVVLQTPSSAAGTASPALKTATSSPVSQSAPTTTAPVSINTTMDAPSLPNVSPSPAPSPMPSLWSASLEEFSRDLSFVEAQLALTQERIDQVFTELATELNPRHS